MTNKEKEQIISYLEAASVLIGEDSDMEDIIYQRDKHYGEDDEIKELIEKLKSEL